MAEATEIPRYRREVLQNAREHDQFLDILRQENVRSYLEIGAMYGGSLWKTAHAMPKGSRVVAVDAFVDTPGAREFCEACVAELVDDGYLANLFVGDSSHADMVNCVSQRGPFDCVFIDGSHLEEMVWQDWDNYGPMARIVAFHDISWNSSWKSKVPGRVVPPMGVPFVWNSVKKDYRHVEIQLQEPRNYYGIGVLWRQ